MSKPQDRAGDMAVLREVNRLAASILARYAREVWDGTPRGNRAHRAAARALWESPRPHPPAKPSRRRVHRRRSR